MAVQQRVRSRPPALYEGFDYQAFWQGPSRRHLDVLEHRVVAELLPAHGRRVVEVGCGYGRLTDAYVDRFDAVVVVDAAWSLLERARDRWAVKGVTLVAADLHMLPFRPGSFDAAVMVRVLHHLEDPGSGLRAVQEVLAGGGRLVANTSNKRNAARILRHAILGRGPDPFAPGLVRYGKRSFGWHPADFREVLEGSGFHPDRWRGVGVLDKVAGALGPFAPVVPTGTGLARALGVVRLAPSLFCSATKLGVEVPLPADPFACPTCGRPTVADRSQRTCAPCGRAYRRRDGIWDFRI